jgi:hypothetical protein
LVSGNLITDYLGFCPAAQSAMGCIKIKDDFVIEEDEKPA